MTNLFHRSEVSRSTKDRPSRSARRRRESHRRARFEALEPRMMLSWTVLTYLDADNNLESYGVLNVNQMEAVGSTSSLKIAVQMDRSPGYDTTNSNWTDTRRALIVHDTSTSTMTSLQGSNYVGIGETNMGSQSALTDFIRWGVANYPADHYLLNLWDHGGGLSGACWDDSSGGDNLTVREIGAAISAAGQHIDVLGFDACEMGMAEVRHEISGLVDVLVSSEADIPGNGWPYDKILTDLAANPAMTASQVGTSIVQRYGQTYGASQTMSATNLATEAALISSINSFAVAAQNSAEWRTITLARFSSARFTDTNYRDLGTFLSYVGSHASNSTLRSAALAASSQYQASMISNFSGSSARGTGMSIYLPGPRAKIRSDYTDANFRFVADTQWNEFLARYTTRAPMGAREPASLVRRTRLHSLPEVLPPVEPLQTSLSGLGTQGTAVASTGSTGAGWLPMAKAEVADRAEPLATLDPAIPALVEARLDSRTVETSEQQARSAAAADFLFAEDRPSVGHRFEADFWFPDA